MKKRLLSAVLVLLMLVAFVPVTAAAEEGKLYGEMPIYLGFPDVDYMAEEILKELDLAEKTAEERERVYGVLSALYRDRCDRRF